MQVIFVPVTAILLSRTVIPEGRHAATSRGDREGRFGIL
jgi:hypothetical protein